LLQERFFFATFNYSTGEKLEKVSKITSHDLMHAYGQLSEPVTAILSRSSEVIGRTAM